MRSAVAADLGPVRHRLEALGQGHVLRFFDELTPEQQAGLLAQVQEADLGALPNLIDTYVKRKPVAPVGGELQPAPYYALSGGRADRAAYRAKGIDLIGAGKVAAFTVAGGQGSRLGYDGPKGCFPGGGVTGKPLFACLAEWIIAAQRRWRPQGAIPWYIMTSPANHEGTVAFFRRAGFFGLAERDVMFFPQGMLPTLEMGTGRLLLASKGELAMNPDGHGGSLRALSQSGALDDMAARGVEHISYTQIDNPLVRVIDPVFLGLHAFAPDSSGQMSSKMVPKAHVGEKVGVFAQAGPQRRTAVIEYSDLPEDLARATGPDGVLRFLAGSIAVHAISVAFARSLCAGGAFSLPLHRAEKRVAHVDPRTGATVQPAGNNAVKLEAFVFDAIPLAERSIVVEADRVEEFAPIKNATGADSPETCRELQTLRAARWLAAAGCRLPYRPDGAPDCTIELSPLRAMEGADLRRGDVPVALGPGVSVAL